MQIPREVWVVTGSAVVGVVSGAVGGYLAVGSLFKDVSEGDMEKINRIIRKSKVKDLTKLEKRILNKALRSDGDLVKSIDRAMKRIRKLRDEAKKATETVETVAATGDTETGGKKAKEYKKSIRKYVRAWLKPIGEEFNRLTGRVSKLEEQQAKKAAKSAKPAPEAAPA